MARSMMFYLEAVCLSNVVERFEGFVISWRTDSASTSVGTADSMTKRVKPRVG